MSTEARLRALVAVADSGSVREAARKLTVTEPAVSAALAALAREVKAPLVEREGRGLRLTAAGEAYASYARRILGLHEEALAAARCGQDAARGLVRVAAVPTAGEHLLPSALALFLAAHPQADLRLEVGPSERTWAMFAAHEADIMIGEQPARARDRRGSPRDQAQPPGRGRGARGRAGLRPRGNALAPARARFRDPRSWRDPAGDPGRRPADADPWLGRRGNRGGGSRPGRHPRAERSRPPPLGIRRARRGSSARHAAAAAVARGDSRGRPRCGEPADRPPDQARQLACRSRL